MFTSTRDGKTDKKRVLGDLKMATLAEIFKTFAIVCHRYQRLVVSKMFTPLFCFSEQLIGLRKRLRETVCKYSTVFTEETGTNRSVGDLEMSKLAQILQPQAQRGEFDVLPFLIHSLYKTSRLLLFDNMRRRQNVISTVVTHSATACVPLFSSVTITCHVEVS